MFQVCIRVFDFCSDRILAAFLSFGVLLVFTSSSTASQLPDYAQQFLNTLPEKKLTMETVMYYSVTQSDSFRRIQAAGIDKEAAYLKASALLTWRLE
ncbi:MAG: hypothetical protein AAF202_13905, partial [Pseudomonadota bacterium]